MDNNTEDKEALDILSKLEESGDVKFDKEEKKVTSLGKASRQFMSDAGESPWKLVALNTLPSKGMMLNSSSLSNQQRQRKYATGLP